MGVRKDEPNKIGLGEMLTVESGQLTDSDGPHRCALKTVERVKSKFNEDREATKFTFECIEGEQKGQVISKTVGKKLAKGTAFHTLLEQMGFDVKEVGAQVPVGRLMEQNYDVLVAVTTLGNDDNGYGGYVVESVRPVSEDK